MVGGNTEEAPAQDGRQRTPSQFMRNSNGMEMKRPPVEAGMHTWGFSQQHLNTAEPSTS